MIIEVLLGVVVEHGRNSSLEVVVGQFSQENVIEVGVGPYHWLRQFFSLE